MITEEDRRAKEKSVSQGGWSSGQRPRHETSEFHSDPIFIEDFSGSDSPLDPVREEEEGEENEKEEESPSNLVVYEDSNAVNSMMQGLYAQSSSASRKLVTQSCPASPAAKRDGQSDGLRMPENGEGPRRIQAKSSSSGKKKLKKNDKRESTHESLAILKELKRENEGQELSSKSKNLTTPRRSEKRFRCTAF